MNGMTVKISQIIDICPKALRKLKEYNTRITFFSEHLINYVHAKT